MGPGTCRRLCPGRRGYDLVLRLARLCLSAGVLLSTAHCTRGPLAPSCDRQTGTILDVGNIISAGATSGYTVTSPRASNLIMVLTWQDTAAALAIRATLTACGDHVGCQVGSVLTAFATGPGSLRLTVDGTRGKQYQVEVTGDAAREQSFTLLVTFDTGACT
jgi:hypothetical protein